MHHTLTCSLCSREKTKKMKATKTNLTFVVVLKSAICLTISMLVGIITKEILRNQANKKHACVVKPRKQKQTILSCKLWYKQGSSISKRLCSFAGPKKYISTLYFSLSFFLLPSVHFFCHF